MVPTIGDGWVMGWYDHTTTTTPHTLDDIIYSTNDVIV